MLHPPTRQVRRRSTIAGTAAALLLAISPVAATAAPATAAPTTAAPARAATADPAPAPPVFGPDWDDPRTAARPIDRPATESCTVRIVDNEFVNFDVYTAHYAPPADCAGDWTMVVLDLHGSVLPATSPAKCAMSTISVAPTSSAISRILAKLIRRG